MLLMCRTKHRGSGFSLMEMLIVIGIIAVLTAIAIPLISSALDRAHEATCLANRRALLAVVRVQMMEDGTDGTETFASLYPTSPDGTDNKQKYSCPLGGTFSWKDYSIECSAHDGSGGSEPPKPVYTGGAFSFTLAENVDTTEYKAGDTVSLDKGRIFKVNDTYYVVIDQYTSQKVKGSDFGQWLYNTDSVEKINFDYVYTQDQLGTDGKCNDYGAICGLTTSGSIYKYNGKLYVQICRFSGAVNHLSSDPTVSTQYWTLLGTEQTP